MDIRERIKNVMVDALVEAKLDEAKPHHPTDPKGRGEYAEGLKRERKHLHARNEALARLKKGTAAPQGGGQENKPTGQGASLAKELRQGERKGEVKRGTTNRYHQELAAKKRS